MPKKLLTLMPEFQMIQDPELRDKTVQVWRKAMEKGSWSVEDLEGMPFTLLIENTSVSLIQHTRAVTLCSIRIGDVLLEKYKDYLSLNRDILLSGALLHDVGKLFEYKREDGNFVKSREGELLRHPISGAAFASQFDLPEEVLHIIAAHSKEGDGARKTVEAVIVNHADFVNFESLKI
ncbi:MAG: HD domain-containing protein [Candidatus Aminicenantes bacterium]|nr:HD domain-containing protein [Candidatus Aminicenantes bacterium]